jgi:hypothetical protein
MDEDEMIDNIIEWYKQNEWFDTDFVYEMQAKESELTDN